MILQARQLRGEMIDAKAFVAASEDLERLCGGQPDAPATDDFADAREELSKLLERRAQAIEARDEKLRDQIASARRAGRDRGGDAVRAGAGAAHSGVSPELPRSNVVPLSGVDPPTTMCRLWVI